MRIFSVEMLTPRSEETKGNDTSIRRPKMRMKKPPDWEAVFSFS